MSIDLNSTTLYLPNSPLATRSDEHSLCSRVATLFRSTLRWIALIVIFPLGLAYCYRRWQAQQSENCARQSEETHGANFCNHDYNSLIEESKEEFPQKPICVQKALEQELQNASNHMQRQPKLDETAQNDFIKACNYGPPIPSMLGGMPKVDKLVSTWVGTDQWQNPDLQSVQGNAPIVCQGRIGDMPYELFGIIDSHGREITEFEPRDIKTLVESSVHGLSDEEIFNGLTKAFNTLPSEEIFNGLTKAFNTLPSTTPLVISLKIGQNLWTVNLGDCRAVLTCGKQGFFGYKNTATIQLSEDAEPNRTPSPKITKIDLNQFKGERIHLIQASHSTWRLFSSAQVASVVDDPRLCQNSSRELAGFADAINRATLHRGSTANCSSLVARIFF